MRRLSLRAQHGYAICAFTRKAAALHTAGGKAALGSANLDTISQARLCFRLVFDGCPDSWFLSFAGARIVPLGPAPAN